jgi:hypothetical protein
MMNKQLCVAIATALCSANAMAAGDSIAFDNTLPGQGGIRRINGVMAPARRRSGF